MTEPVTPAAPPGDALQEPPPFWQRWSQLYWFVAGLLAANVLVFWLLSRWAT